MDDWTQIKAEYIRGGITYTDLSKKYGVSFSTLEKTARRENWKELKRKSSEKQAKILSDTVAKQEAKKVDLIDTIADQMLQKISEMMSEADITSSPSNMRQLSMTLKDIREIKGYKSELDRQEQMARIEKLKKEVQEDQTEKEIKVVFMPEISEYSK